MYPKFDFRNSGDSHVQRCQVRRILRQVDGFLARILEVDFGINHNLCFRINYEPRGLFLSQQPVFAVQVCQLMGLVRPELARKMAEVVCLTRDGHVRPVHDTIYLQIDIQDFWYTFVHFGAETRPFSTNP